MWYKIIFVWVKKHLQSVSVKWIHQFIEMYQLVLASILDNSNTLPYILKHVTKLAFYFIFFRKPTFNALDFGECRESPQPASQSCFLRRTAWFIRNESACIRSLTFPCTHLIMSSSLPSCSLSALTCLTNSRCSAWSTSLGVSGQRSPLTAIVQLMWWCYTLTLGNKPEISGHWDRVFHPEEDE